MLGRREGREHLTVQEFLKVKKFNLESGTALKASQRASTANPEVVIFISLNSHAKACDAGVERPVHLKRAISS